MCSLCVQNAMTVSWHTFRTIDTLLCIAYIFLHFFFPSFFFQSCPHIQCLFFLRSLSLFFFFIPYLHLIFTSLALLSFLFRKCNVIVSFSCFVTNSITLMSSLPYMYTATYELFNQIDNSTGFNTCQWVNHIKSKLTAEREREK